MNGRETVRELALALVFGAATWLGVRLAQRLEQPYSEPRLTLDNWINNVRGGGA